MRGQTAAKGACAARAHLAARRRGSGCLTLRLSRHGRGALRNICVRPQPLPALRRTPPLLLLSMQLRSGLRSAHRPFQSSHFCQDFSMAVEFAINDACLVQGRH